MAHVASSPPAYLEQAITDEEATIEERNETLIAERSERAICRFERKKPDGIWLMLYRGQDRVRMPNGTDIEAPAHPTFPDEGQVREWLEAGEVTARAVDADNKP